jgi:hypothetical protein
MDHYTTPTTANQTSTTVKLTARLPRTPYCPVCGEELPPTGHIVIDAIVTCGRLCCTLAPDWPIIAQLLGDHANQDDRCTALGLLFYAPKRVFERANTLGRHEARHGRNYAILLNSLDHIDVDA